MKARPSPTRIKIDPAALVALGIPARLCDRLAGSGYRFKPRSGERRVWGQRQRLAVSVWAERHRQVTMSAYPGRWKNATTPWTVGIMDAGFHPGVETVIVCKTPQTGVSEAINNCIAYAADASPAPTLYVYPDELTARENSRDRLRPMFTGSGRLRKLLTGAEDDLANLRINLKSMPIYLAWAGSAARLGNKPIGRLVLDEVDKYPDFANQREASPIALAEKRTLTFGHRRKIWKISTPTTVAGPIWQALINESEVVFNYWARCPDCGREQMLEFKFLQWPKSIRDPERLRGHVHYGCPGCGVLWDDAARDAAVAAGSWRAAPPRSALDPDSEAAPESAAADKEAYDPLDPAAEPGLELSQYLAAWKPRKIGFHLPALVSRFVPLADVAAAFLKGRESKAELRDFKNAYEARPWVVYEVARREDAVLALRDDRPKGVVPGPDANGRPRVCALTAGVDTQDYGFYYAIRAWAPGPTRESWLINEGLVDSSAALLEILFETEYKDSEGHVYPLELVIQDAMGHRTAEVYDLCRKGNRRRHLPFKGERRLSPPWKISQLEYYPASVGKNRAIPGGLKLMRADSNYYKDMLDQKLNVSPSAPGAFHLHSEATEDYARQLCAEYVDDKGLWALRGGRANHYWDCEYLNFVAADYRRLRFRSTAPPAPRPAKPKPAAPAKAKRSLW